jgi:hypothetical protein
MDLGLPPESLMQDYFSYFKIVAEKGGGSAAARQYRLDHPAWDKWGRDNLDWQPVTAIPQMPSISNKLARQRAV